MSDGAEGDSSPPSQKSRFKAHKHLQGAQVSQASEPPREHPSHIVLTPNQINPKLGKELRSIHRGFSIAPALDPDVSSRSSEYRSSFIQ